MPDDIYDYLDLIEEDVRRINAILIDTGAGIDVTKEDLDNHVCIFAFDLLFLNGERLLNKTLFERRTILKETFKKE